MLNKSYILGHKHKYICGTLPTIIGAGEYKSPIRYKY